MTSVESLIPGHRLGRYELIRPIARGGMATVWAARLMGPRGFQKIVAMKVMLREVRDEPGVEEMFLAEARLVSLIRHPNVVEVLDLGDDDGRLHLVMEWVHGAPLTSVIAAAQKRGGMGLAIAIRIIRQVCAGLAAAHALTDEHGEPVGLVHRDVSPHNVLVGFNGVVKVADFGIAKVMAASPNKTEFGQLKGKIAYMAPEQLRFEPVDQRTDVFAVGILLYFLTTGVHPFKRAEQHDTVRALLSDEAVVAPSSLVEHYPSRLERIVLKALAKAPSNRYPTAEALALDLAAATPPSSKGEELIQEYLRDLLPDVYQQGIDLARTAMEGLVPVTSSSSALVAQPKTRSNSTLRAVAVSTTPSFVEAPDPAETGDRSSEDGVESERLRTVRHRTPGVVGAVAALGAVVVFAGAMSHSSRSVLPDHARASSSGPITGSVQAVLGDPRAPASPASAPSSVPPAASALLPLATSASPPSATAATATALGRKTPAVPRAQPGARPKKPPAPQKGGALVDLKDPYGL